MAARAGAVEKVLLGDLQLRPALRLLVAKEEAAGRVALAQRGLMADPATMAGRVALRGVHRVS